MSGQHCAHTEEPDEIAELQGTLTLTWVDDHPGHRQYAALLRLVEIARQAEARLRDVTAERDRYKGALEVYADPNNWGAVGLRWSPEWFDETRQAGYAIAQAALSPTEGRAAPQGEREE